MLVRWILPKRVSSNSTISVGEEVLSALIRLRVIRGGRSLWAEWCGIIENLLEYKLFLLAWTSLLLAFNIEKVLLQVYLSKA